MDEKPSMDYIRKISGGDLEFETKLMNVIKAELTEEVEDYYKYLAENNFKETAASVHKLKHKISILGLENSYRLAASFEEELLHGNIQQSTEFEKILQSMVAFIAKL